MEPNHCVDCGKEVYWRSTRCKSCARKGELNPRFVGGKEFWQKEARKTLVLAAGRIEGEKWDIRVRVSSKGRIHNSWIYIEGRDPSIRDKDKHWFDFHLGDFMKGKEIHHDWENDAVCYVLSPGEHRGLHNG